MSSRLRLFVVVALTALVVAIPASAASASAAPAPTRAAKTAAATPRSLDLGGLITSLGNTLAGILPVGGSTISSVTGTVGGVVTGLTQPITETLTNTLHDVVGTVGSVLDNSALSGLLGSVGLGGSTNGVAVPTVTGGGGGKVVSVPGGVVLDNTAPKATVTVLTHLRSVGSVGKVKLRIKSDEAGILALTGALRPGAETKAAKRAHAKHSRKLISFPAAVLGYRKPGALNVTLKLGAAARRSLARSQNARLSLTMLTADAAHNQAGGAVRRSIKR